MSGTELTETQKTMILSSISSRIEALLYYFSDKSEVANKSKAVFSLVSDALKPREAGVKADEFTATFSLSRSNCTTQIKNQLQSILHPNFSAMEKMNVINSERDLNIGSNCRIV